VLQTGREVIAGMAEWRDYSWEPIEEDECPPTDMRFASPMQFAGEMLCKALFICRPEVTAASLFSALWPACLIPPCQVQKCLNRCS